ncbi:hypothetical protein BUY00_06355 [Staphylococcus chromogenes]|nr:hypothetical protein BU648_03780 [Staphylococcus chromogenes]PTG84320.1 hypothetical protein BU665_03705 [Staphylococcus chromogenes]PUZ21121.1 hypothetical protein BUY00_06355 [Staphylococcus chromogenes]QDW92205.1 hypothetical protein DWB97_09545 [Staphylococcus chromogenes]QDX01257.1 hypothetical protein DWB90_09535 [Staphylococcus chromogenes]
MVKFEPSVDKFSPIRHKKILPVYIFHLTTSSLKKQVKNNPTSKLVGHLSTRSYCQLQLIILFSQI